MDGTKPITLGGRSKIQRKTSREQFIPACPSSQLVSFFDYSCGLQYSSAVVPPRECGIFRRSRQGSSFTPGSLARLIRKKNTISLRSRAVSTTIEEIQAARQKIISFMLRLERKTLLQVLGHVTSSELLINSETLISRRTSLRQS